MNPDDLSAGQIGIAYDRNNDEVVVATPNKQVGLAPEKARDLADVYEAAANEGEVADVGGTREFIRTLRRYADIVE